MIRYYCDRCKCEIDPHVDLRFEIAVEAMPAMDDSQCNDGLGHLEVFESYLEQSDASMECGLGEDLYIKRKFDVCHACYKQYLQNPLGVGVATTLDFSNN